MLFVSLFRSSQIFICAERAAFFRRVWVSNLKGAYVDEIVGKIR